MTRGRSAVFVDLSSLNTVFKLGDKFVCALNYRDGLEHLSEVMPSLGTGYDIYLNLLPRIAGDGDMVIPELTVGGLPFTVNSEELYKVLAYFRASSGVGEVYLCNGIVNYIACAKVPSFESVFFHGNKVIYIRVKDKLLEEYRLFDSQFEFSEEFGSSYAGYGDADLVDVSRISAQYPELSAVSKVQMACLAPLVQCYRGPAKIATAELYGRLLDKFQHGHDLDAEYKTRAVEDNVPHSGVDQNIQPSEELPSIPEDYRRERKKLRFGFGRTTAVAKVFIGVSCILAFTIGVFGRISVDNTGSSVDSQYFSDIDNRIALMKSLTTTYSGATENTANALEAFDYISSSRLSVVVTGFTYRQTGSEVRCACASTELSDSYREYIENRYTVLSTNDLGEAWSESGTVYQFSVLFQ